MWGEYRYVPEILGGIAGTEAQPRTAQSESPTKRMVRELNRLAVVAFLDIVFSDRRES